MKGFRILWILMFSLLSVGVVLPAHSQQMHAVATVDAKGSSLRASSDGARLTLGLSTAVPFRVFTLNEPDRLILDFQEVDWRGLPRDKFHSDDITSELRFGTFQPGWSRMVIDLNKPMTIRKAEMVTGSSPRLEISLVDASRLDFDRASGHEQASLWLHKPAEIVSEPKTTLRIAIDPGHGGVDPGAVREGVMEKDIALTFSQELAAIIRDQTDYQVVLTRDADFSVSLSDRVRFARQIDADLFLSIHSNTVTWGDASGASVYTLSNRASDEASARLAELENRADLASGLSGHVEGDDVARVLVDLSRVDTNARSNIFAAKLIENLHESVGVLRSKPHRYAGFKVLKAHDIPSVLLELGFLSNHRDRKNMQNKEWRRDAAFALVDAIEGWDFEDKERAKLVLK